MVSRPSTERLGGLEAAERASLGDASPEFALLVELDSTPGSPDAPDSKSHNQTALRMTSADKTSSVGRSFRSPPGSALLGENLR
jgi:hypothetical protein